MLYRELHEKALEVKDKFYERLSDKEKALINYRNLFNTIKYSIEQTGHDFDSIFLERCLIKNVNDIEDVNVYTIAQAYWNFIQIDARLINQEYMNFSLVLDRNKWSLIDKVELLYTITISKYGYYLDLSNLKRIDYIDIEEALNRLERSIHGEKIKKAGVI